MHEGGFEGLPSVGSNEVAVGDSGVLCVDHGPRASPEQVGTTRSKRLGESVEVVDKIVVELHKYFASGHDHMVEHMHHES